MESIVEEVAIVLKPLDRRLTSDAFRRVCDQYMIKKGVPLEKAYEMAVDFCISHEMSLCYSDFISFKRSYYFKINGRNKKRH